MSLLHRWAIPLAALATTGAALFFIASMIRRERHARSRGIVRRWVLDRPFAGDAPVLTAILWAAVPLWVVSVGVDLSEGRGWSALWGVGMAFSALIQVVRRES